ncbi:MAG: hypothetical protein ACP5QO_11535 [Clostridia bacterium]
MTLDRGNSPADTAPCSASAEAAGVVDRAWTRDWFDSPNAIFRPGLSLSVYARLVYLYLCRRPCTLYTQRREPWFLPALAEPTPEQCQNLADVIRPTGIYSETRKARRLPIAVAVDQFTSEQKAILDAVRHDPQLLVDGLADTGKTTLALESAKEPLKAGRHTLVVCFNRFLAYQLRDTTGGWGPDLQVMTLHQFLRKFVQESPPNPSPEFFTRVLPHAAQAALLASGPLFDEIIVDEAQDVLTPAYMDVLDVALRGGLMHGRWRMFGDFHNQVIYDEVPADPLALLPGAFTRIELRTNCRNPWVVAQLLDQCAPSGERFAAVRRADNGRPFRIAGYRDNHRAGAVLRAVLDDVLADLAYAPGDLIVLSPHGRHSLAREVQGLAGSVRVEAYDPEGLAAGVHPAAVRYASVWGYKGLESPVVVLTDFDDPATAPGNASLPDLFYAGASRALDQVILVSQFPQGPPWLAERLTSASRSSARATSGWCGKGDRSCLRLRISGSA